jgi:hypothetical protein
VPSRPVTGIAMQWLRQSRHCDCILKVNQQGPDFDDLKIFKKMTYKMTGKIQKNDLKYDPKM